MKKIFFLLIFITIITFGFHNNIYALSGYYNNQENTQVTIEDTENNFDNQDNDALGIALAVPLISLIISFILWLAFGRDDKPVEPVELYPPKELNSLEVSYIYEGKLKNYAVTSLLIYLAHKGYIKITEVSTGLEYKPKTYKLTKQKEYDGTNEIERIFMEGLFEIRPPHLSRNKEVKKINEITVLNLYNSFYLVTNDIRKKMDRENRTKVFEQSSLIMQKLVLLILFINLFVIALVPFMPFSNIESTYPAIIGVFLQSVGVTVIDKTFTDKIFINKTSYLILGLILLIVPLFIFIFPSLKTTAATIIYIIGIICAIGMYILYRSMPKRTPYSLKLFGRIKGFKKFLELAKKEELEAEVEKNPNYFYDILPYTYALNISNKWIKEFEYINLTDTVD